MGKLFVIDGTDGSGKQTQFELLKKRLSENNIDYKVASFPNYDSPSSSLVKMYLSGEFGQNANDVSAYIASTFYAADRYATFKKDFEKFYNNGGIIIADRYTTANMVHQAGKISDEKERDEFLEWLTNFEYGLYGLPKPAEVFFLNMPVEVAMELIKDRDNKFSHQKEKDIHEKDENHLINAHKAACYVAKKYGWFEVDCVKDGKLRTIEDISDEIFDEIMKHIKD